MKKFKCDICDKQYKTIKILNSHIKKYHSNEIYKISHVVCKICNKNLLNIECLSKHLKECHNVDKKLYYDMFTKGKNEGICKICGKETKYDKKTKKYRIHCSPKCANNDSETRLKIKKTCLIRFGTEYPQTSEKYRDMFSDIWKNKTKEELEIIKNKSKQTCLEKYGVDNPAKSELVKNKMKETCFKKYGTEYALGSKEVIEKRKSTNLKKYGCENVFQNKEIIKKIRKKMTEIGYKIKDDSEYTEFQNYNRKCVQIIITQPTLFNYV